LDGNSSSRKIFTDGLVISGNSLYVQDGNARVHCGSVDVSLEKFHAMGYDIGTKVYNYVPDTATIIKWATELLSPNSVNKINTIQEN